MSKIEELIEQISGKLNSIWFYSTRTNSFEPEIVVLMREAEEMLDKLRKLIESNS